MSTLELTKNIKAQLLDDQYDGGESKFDEIKAEVS